jgi:hypothetical protein
MDQNWKDEASLIEDIEFTKRAKISQLRIKQREDRATDEILNAVKGMDVSDALKILDACKSLILSYSPVSYPWDRLREELEKY